jgi:uncharacterized damage-inducible protein DinB
MTTTIPRPAPDEHNPYYGKYIDLVPDGDLVAQLAAQVEQTVALLQANRDRADNAYAPGKWTVKQVIGHLCDGERVFTYRAMRFARADTTELPGFDENAYVDAARFQDRSLDDLLSELRAIRGATVALANGLNSNELARRGSANGNPITVRALLYITAGHERHHVGLLRERYGLAG